MMQNYWGYMINNWSSWKMPFTVGAFFGFSGFMMLILIVWMIYWKGAALWKAARRNERNWFIALLIINTLGILEILYIYIFSKKPTEEKNPTA